MKPFLLALSIAVVGLCSGVGQAAAPDPKWQYTEPECSFTCNSKGYELRVYKDGPGDETRYAIQVEKRPIVQYMPGKNVVHHFGSTQSRPWEELVITKVKDDATASDELCDISGFGLTGTVYEVSQRNPLDFERGEVRLRAKNLCDRGAIKLIDPYNQRAPAEQRIPQCGKEGCIKAPKPKEPGDGIYGARGCLPAEYENWEAVPKEKRAQLWKECRAAAPGLAAPTASFEGLEPAQSDCRWTDWLNRDSPGGSGDYETLKDFLAAGVACPRPQAVQCATLDNVPASQTGQEVRCDTEIGFACANRGQARGQRCRDYQVRFCCRQ